ncbi:hypothetical protein ACTD5D_30950 [Nocardia takedensis]|uniref:hypothetical protein n=1 Tax=Nocardia takedensis TaxID=259390 RepID=UPI003F7767BD
MNHNQNDPYTRAMRLRRDLFDATAAANNPHLLYPDRPKDAPRPDLSGREEAAELDYYRHLDAHRSELGTHPDFELEYSILDDLAAEGRDITDLRTDTSDIEQHFRPKAEPPIRDRPSRTRGR